MHEIDSIRIVFTQDTATIMNVCLAFLMFGVALDIKLADFRRIVRYPKGAAIGLTSQLVLLPLLTLALIKVWGPVPSLALGLILIAACPGGNVSNFAVHLARGNAALSITMTSVVTLGAVITTPLVFAATAHFVPSTRPILAELHIAPARVALIIFQLILIPLALGMLLNHHRPAFTARIRRGVRTISILLFAAFILFAIIANWAHIVNHLYIVFALVVVHNLLALTVGYWFARSSRLPVRDARAICMETGIQNAGLGLILIINFFSNLGGMMLVAAFWGVWDLISSFLLALYWSRRPVTQPATAMA